MFAPRLLRSGVREVAGVLWRVVATDPLWAPGMIEKAKRRLKRGGVPRIAGLAAALVVIAWFGIERVEWDHKADPGDFIVGLGTLALAVGTFLLARHAKREIELSERPYVVGSPHKDHTDGIQFTTDSTSLIFWFRAWNIGSGPAVLTNVSLQEEKAKRELVLFSTPRPLAVEGVADFGMRVISHTTPLPDTFLLTFYYQDGSRRNYVTEMSMHRSKDSMIVVPVTYFQKRIKLGDLLSAFERQE